MACNIQLVSNDTGTDILVQLTSNATGLPPDLSNVGTSAAMKVRRVGATDILATLVGAKLPGFNGPDGILDTSGAYSVAGAGGRLSFPLDTTLVGLVGQFEASITVTFPGPVIQTVYETVRFSVRPAF